MQNLFGDHPVRDEQVEEACRVLLDYMQLRELKTFCFAGDYTSPVTQAQERLIVYAATGQHAIGMENRLQSLPT